jgi:peptidoglycan/LPS O-acetylase OafA/YrhL
LGETSYAMYLFHHLVIAFLARLIFARLFGNDHSAFATSIKLSVTLITVIISSIFLYKLLDLPIQKALRKLIKR